MTCRALIATSVRALVLHAFSLQTRQRLLRFSIALLILTALTSSMWNVESSSSAPFSGTPYSGSPLNLPGRIEAENFDNGGEAVAYHDTTATNDGGSYRTEGVDVCTCGSPYGFSVGWTNPGEWMEYTVTIASYGSYKFQPLSATTVTGAALHINVDGVNVTGQMNLPNTNAWGSYAATSSQPVTLSAGPHIVRVAIDAGGFLLDSVDVIRLNTPYGGTATVLPGTIPAENFDLGGEGAAYHDTTATNDGGAYRSEGVDLCFCAFANGAALGWSQTGEWTRYTVNVSATDTYTLQATISTIATGSIIHLEIDGVNVTGQMILPNTGAWGTWTTISKSNLQISAGQHDLRMVIDSGGFLLDSLAAIPSVPSAPSALTANAVSTTQINLAWVDNSFNESGFKIERKTGPSGTYSEIATTAAGATTFNNTGLQPSTQYFYRVRATNLGGNSTYSNEASAMTSNLLPSVSVTAPTTGTVFTAPANIAITVSASDSDGTVSKVEFFQDSTKLGEDLIAPYTFSWTSVAAGTYNLTAKATDNVGGISTSAVVNITVNALPSVSITVPAANTIFNSPANVTINASASDSDGTISKVEFFQNGTLLGEDTTPPYSYVWTSAPLGTFSLTARATDNRNATTTSSAVSITVNNPPSVSISSPATNSSWPAASTISIAATASDTDGTISKVEFYQGATKLGEDLSSPFTFAWANAQQGSYSLTAVATDNRGAITTSGAVSVNVVDNSVARLDPLNEVGGRGENPLSRNFNWQLPLLNLPGRAGLDLSINLSYNSLVWTRSANFISFDLDKGFPSPGFKLGFPTIQNSYLNSQTGKSSYLLIGSDGSHTELRQLAVNSIYYESADSAHLLLDTTNLSSGDPSMLLRTMDGTRLTYKPKGLAYECTEIKDRNGNYITINYNAAGQIANIHDTLDRVITFNYDNGSLVSITQIWKRPSNPAETVTHTWASFTYANLTIQTNFNGLTAVGPAGGPTIKVLSRVTLDDNSNTPEQNSYFNFDYTTWGQVWKMSNFAADNHLLNYRSYNLPQNASNTQTDCPRFTERRDWVEKWNQNEAGTEQEAITGFTAPQAGTATVPGQTPRAATVVQVTNPDGTFSKIYFLGTAGTSSGWQVGLPFLVDSYDVGGTIPQRQAATTWDQDDPNLPYLLNPRVIETNIYDPAGNRKRTSIAYQQFTPTLGGTYKLPVDVFEYTADDPNIILRRTHTDYVDADIALKITYWNRHILGLAQEKTIYDGNATLMTRVGFSYDETGSVQAPDPPVQHDPSYGASFTERGNLSTVKRYNISNGQFTASTMKYNTAGAVVSSKDALNHEVKIDYTDAFSDNVSRNTFAYPTKITDPDSYWSSSVYNFDFGAVTQTETPPPNETGTPNPQPAGPRRTFTYDDLGRLERTSSLVNNAYTRLEYNSSGTRVDTYATIQEGQGEAHSFKITDGVGRVIATAVDHPGSVGGYTAQRFVYNVIGRVSKTSNPTETSASGAPSQWVTSGDDAAAGWVYTQQTYDWKSRPLLTTNQDGTTRNASYSGCGCAGGEVVTLTDEMGRQQKVYSDVLGRAWKTEQLSWPDQSNNRTVYSTTVQVYNARDQVIRVKQYAGSAPAAASSTNAAASCPTGTCQETVMGFDGYGRLQSKHLPEQNSGTAIVYAYNPDDTILSVTDARGATATHGYNNRHLVTGITYTAPPGSNIPATPNITIAYDAAGNRSSMTDGMGSKTYSYNQLSQLMSETRTFSDPENPVINGITRTVSYDYNLAGQLKRVTDPFNATINYSYDSTGRVGSITGTSFSGVTTYTTNMQYRAWGGLKHLNYGNTRTLDMGYNSRLQTTSFGIPTVMNKTYEYNSDGALRYSHDLINDRFDRSYSYDHISRMTGAVSGPVARGQADTEDRPYLQSFAYDAFNHLTSQSGNHWSMENLASDATFTNNRRDFSGYDADGNYLSGNLPDFYIYDSAGQITTVQTFANNDTTIQVFDVDGLRVKTKETTHITGQTFTQVTYYITSSVLGGRVLTELTENGGKQRTFVYAGSQVLAWQTLLLGTEQLVWEHRDPSNASFRTTNPNGSLNDQTAMNGRAAELDPAGADAALVDPYLFSPPFEENQDSLIAYPSFGSAGSLGTTYSWDGIRMPADELFEMVNTLLHGRFGIAQALMHGTRVSGTRTVTERWRVQPHVQQPEDSDDVVRINTVAHYFIETSYTMPLYGTDSLGVELLTAAPQKTIPVENLRSNVERLLRFKNPNRKLSCGEAIQQLLDKAAEMFPKWKGQNSKSFMEAFDRIAGQGNYVAELFPGMSHAGGTVDGDAFASLDPGHGARPAKVYLHPFQYFNNPNNAMAQLYYAFTALHETFHLAARGGYSDEDMARVVFALTGNKGLPSDSTKDQMPWSNYWDNYLQQHCMPNYLSDIK